MLVREVMTSEVQCCSKDDTAQAVAQVMKDRDVGVVPIVEDGQQPKVVGIVTDRDLCLDVVAAGKKPADVKVADLLKEQVVACYADDDIEDAADLMAVNQVRRLPVLDDDDHLVGIVSIGDVSRQRAIEPQDTGEVLSAISEPDDQSSGKSH